MSAVYLARRTDGQFEQTVALKIMAGQPAARLSSLAIEVGLPNG